MAYRIYTSEVRAITDAVTNINSSGAAYPVEPDTVSSLDLRRWFLNLFPCRISSVIRRSEGSRWLDVSRFYHLSDDDIIECITPAARSQRGFRFDEKTMFLVLSIPAHSPYHNVESVLEIRELLKNQLGVSPRHYQLDDDWYLYLFLTGEVPAQEAGRNLRDWCVSQGFDIAGGALEVHPSDKPLPFPLQNRFTWYNDKGQLLVRRTELSTEDAIAFFLQDAGQNSVEPEPFFERMRLHAFGFAQDVKEEELVSDPAAQSVETEAQGVKTEAPAETKEESTGSELSVNVETPSAQEITSEPELLSFHPTDPDIPEANLLGLRQAAQEIKETAHAVDSPDKSSATDNRIVELVNDGKNIVQLPTLPPVAVPENFVVQEAQLLLFPGLADKKGSIDDGTK